MKKTFVSILGAATAALLTLASPATAGILTLDDGSPTYTPDSAFTNNTIVVDTVVVGGLIHVVGGVTVNAVGTNNAMIDVSGTYSADAGDTFSIAYSFTADFNLPTAVPYTLSGSIDVFGTPQAFEVNGTLMPGLHQYEGTAQVPVPFPTSASGTFSGSLTLDFLGPMAPLAAAPGTLDLNFQQLDFQLDPTPAAVQAPSQSQNISTRANVGTGDNVLIGGFIITGNNPKQVVLRAIGPSLALSGVSGVLADPLLELHDSTGATVATNDNWMDLSAEDQTTLNDNMLAPSEDAESALVVTLDPGAYTAIVRGVNDTTGVGLVEAYDIDAGTTDSKLANISTRGFVETGDNVMIGGFILGGGGGGFSTVVVRGIGPSLANDGVANVLADPVIEIHNSDGDLIDSNDNWMDDPNMQQVSDAGLAPTDPNEAALYKILPAGAYTAILFGAGDSTGVGLVESYNTD